jgi:hypothetical protein
MLVEFKDRRSTVYWVFYESFAVEDTRVSANLRVGSIVTAEWNFLTTPLRYYCLLISFVVFLTRKVTEMHQFNLTIFVRPSVSRHKKLNAFLRNIILGKSL